MSTAQLETRVAYLREQLLHHNHLYYVLSDPELSDAQYDALFLELKELEAKYPELITPDSPTQRVGGFIDNQFKTVTHAFPMLSLGNVFSKEELDQWRANLPMDTELVAEWKLDGVSLSLTYNEGVLQSAVTRGTGIEGDDVTRNALYIQGIPRKLPKALINDVITVRGEVVVTREAFATINDQLQQQGLKQYKNERNYASGSLRQKDPKVTAQRALRFVAYSYHSVMSKVDDYRKLRQEAIDHGFEYVAELAEPTTFERTEDNPYVVDGIVFKVTDLNVQEALGYRSREPRWAIAYKFPASANTSTLLAVDWQVGRTGNLTPVARIEPIHLHGVVVTNVTLHNPEEIERLGLALGSHVVVERRGDVIPKIMGLALPNPTTIPLNPIETPTHCPECGAQTLPRIKSKSKKEVELGVGVYCPNAMGCKAQLKGRMIHFVSRSGLDIDGLGEQTIGALVDLGLLTTWVDLFRLQPADFLKVEGYAERSAVQAVEAIQDRAKHCTLMALLEALGITSVGKGGAKRLAEALRSMDRLKVALPQTLELIPDIGKDTACNIVAWLQEHTQPLNELLPYLTIVDDNVDAAPHMQGTATEAILVKMAKRDKLTNDEMDWLRQQWVWWGWHESCGTAITEKGPLEGQVWVLTGALEHYTREEATVRLEALGAKVSNSVSKKTTCVIAGPGAGSKETKARSMGIPIHDESYLKTILD